jgi:hypothetical protein
MRAVTDNFQLEHVKDTLQPRYTIGLSFSDYSTSIIANLFLRSEEFTNTGAWPDDGGAPVRTANTDVAPDTTTTADSLQDNGSIIRGVRQTVQEVDGYDVTKTYTCSIFVKKDAVAKTTRYPMFQISHAGSTTEAKRVWLDTSTGEVAGDGVGQFGAIDYDANYWRVWVQSASVDQANDNFYLIVKPAWGANATLGLGSSSSLQGTIVVWGAQLNEGSLIDYVKSVDTQGTGTGPDSDITYLTSHADALTPDGVADVDIISASIVDISGLPQRINPDTAQHTIGDLRLEILDEAGIFTTKIKDKLDGGEGLRKKRVILYQGHKGLTDFADYSKQLTYLVEDMTYNPGGYKLVAQDIKRTFKTTIMRPHQGALTSSITAGSLEIPVTIADAANQFPTLEHDANFSSNPSATVGYIKIDDEIIAHSGWNGGVTALVVVKRGALNTNPVKHTVDINATANNKKLVAEYIYIEMAAPRLIYYLFTGLDPAAILAAFPDHWHLGISTDFVRLSDFTDIGDDLWNTTTGGGRMAKFQGLVDVKAKDFIENELLLWLPAFTPVHADGTIGIKRLQNPLPQSSYLKHLTDFEIVSARGLHHDMKAVINNILILWNYLDNEDRFIKTTNLIDVDSIAKHTLADTKVYKFKGVYLGQHSDEDLQSYFNNIRDRYNAPPHRLKVDVHPEFSLLEVGDMVRIELPNLIDFNTGLPIDRVYEIQGARQNWRTGLVTWDLFGGIEPAAPFVISSNSVLLDSFYTAAGTELSTVLTISAGAVTASGSLTGNADHNSAVYYYDGNLTINAGVVVTIGDNVQLRIKGFLTVNGKIDGKGVGFAGASATGALQGALGSAGICGASLTYQGCENPEPLYIVVRESAAQLGSTTIKFNSFGGLNIVNEGGSAITGIPTDLRGTSGGSGNGASDDRTFQAAGGAGGDSGGGLVLICRGMAFGASGEIDLSGDTGLTASTFAKRGVTFYAGAGQGGFPGGCIVILDGNVQAPLLANFKCQAGDTPIPDVAYNLPWEPFDYWAAKRNGSAVTFGRPFNEAGLWDFKSGNVFIHYLAPPVDKFEWSTWDQLRETPGARLYDFVELRLNNWTVDELNLSGSFYSVEYSPDLSLFCATGIWSGADMPIFTSPDGLVWTERSNPGNTADYLSRACRWGGGLYVVGGGNISPSGAGFIMTSPDGITWTVRTVPNSRRVESVAYGLDSAGAPIWVAVGLDDATDAGLWTSPDGITWTERANPKAFDLIGVIYGGGRWVAVGGADGTDAYIITATDPTGTWTERANPKNFGLNSVAFANEIYVAAGNNSGTKPYIIWSLDGTTWNEASTKTFTGEFINEIRAFDGVFVAVGSWIDTDNGNLILTSEDGAVWSQVKNDSPQAMKGIAYDRTRFVAVSDSTAALVMRTVPLIG